MTIAKVVKDKILGKSKVSNCPNKQATFALKIKDERTEKTQAIVLSIMSLSVPLYIFLLTQICKSCGSLKRIFLSDELINRNTQEVLKVCRRCGHKVLGGCVDEKGNVFWLSGGESSDLSGGAGGS